MAIISALRGTSTELLQILSQSHQWRKFRLAKVTQQYFILERKTQICVPVILFYLICGFYWFKENLLPILYLVTDSWCRKQNTEYVIAFMGLDVFVL